MRWQQYVARRLVDIIVVVGRGDNAGEDSCSRLSCILLLERVFGSSSTRYFLCVHANEFDCDRSFEQMIAE